MGQARCTVAPDGSLTGYAPASASPERMGFPEAAVAVAQVMRMNPWTDDGGPVGGAMITLPIRFEPPGSARRS